MRIALVAVLAACSTTPPPAPVHPEPAVVVAPATTLQRLLAGEMPNSTPHRWGARFYELRVVAAGASGAGLELRLHDEMSFQGVGMRPDQMPPMRHTCSAWEALPATIHVPQSATSCSEARAECAAIDAHLRATAKASADAAFDGSMFGRAPIACAG